VTSAPIAGRWQWRIVRVAVARTLTIVRSLGLRLRSPRLIALAWRLATTPIPVSGLRSGARPRRLVVLPKVGGTEDLVAALAGRGEVDLALVGLPRAEVKHVWRRMMGAYATGLGDIRYCSDDPAVEAAKSHYRTFLIEVLRHYVPAVRVAGFVGANFAYYAERELAAAAEALDVPFLVLHKESIRTPAQRPWFTRAYRELIGPFTGRSLAVYAEDERTSMIEGAVAGPDRIHVTGAPRIDALHRLRADRHAAGSESDAPSDAPMTVLFAVDPAAGTWTPYDAVQDTGAPRWDRLASALEAAFVAAAVDDPAHRYAIKVKLGREQTTLARLPGGLPTNLAVVTGGTATDLLAVADVAVAFNTTVVAEAIAAGVPVLVPAFAEVAGAHAWTFPVEGAVTELPAAEALAPAILRARAGGRHAVLAPAQQEVLRRLVGDAEGRAGDRVWSWLVRELGPSRSPSGRG
jgi:hypothetical protein